MSRSQHTHSQLHAAFLHILPRIEGHGQVYFRHLKSPEAREEAIAEMTALCWRWFIRLHERGKNPDGFVSAFASFAAKTANRNPSTLDGTLSGLNRSLVRAEGVVQVSGWS